MVWPTAAWCLVLEGLGSVVGATVDQQRPDLQPSECVTVNSPLLLGLDAGLTRPSHFRSSISSLYYY